MEPIPQNQNLWICNYGQILTVNLHVKWKNTVNFDQMAITYVEESFMY